MTSREALLLTRQTLRAAKFDEATIESELLLRHVLGISRTKLYSEPERILTPVEIKELQILTNRRLLREPIAYILGHCEFYGHDFYLDQRVFIPRPETELMVEQAIKFAQHHYHSENQFAIADIGTGSGVIAISLALALPKVRIYATDIAASALQVANINCRRYQVAGQVVLVQGSLLESLPEPVNVIVANLPYVKNSEIINSEPAVALAGGEDGLDIIRQLLIQVRGKIHSKGCLLLEIGYGQGEAVNSLIHSCFPQAKVELIPDLAGINRVTKVIL
jgi:release factor glutamine methyltransferase